MESPPEGTGPTLDEHIGHVDTDLWDQLTVSTVSLVEKLPLSRTFSVTPRF